MSVRLVRGALQASLKASSILRVLTPRSVPITRSFGLFSSNGKKEDEKESAHKELREAVRELSQGLARPTTSSSTSNLKDMDASPPSELEVDQLEELARAHYEGEVDGSEASVTKAVEIWTEAAERGSVESQYSLATLGTSVRAKNVLCSSMAATWPGVRTGRRRLPLVHFSRAIGTFG